MGESLLHTQVQLNGMPKPQAQGSNPARSSDIVAGRKIIYVGHFQGGPRCGTRGIVLESKGRKARVSLGIAGIWNIPCYFLTMDLAKAA